MSILSDGDCRELLHGFIQNHPQHSVELYKRVKTLVRQFHHHGTRLVPEELDEVTQEALCKIFNAAHTIKTNCPAWIMAVVRNTCMDALRARNKNRNGVKKNGTSPEDAEAAYVDMEIEDHRALSDFVQVQVFTNPDTLQQLECIEVVLKHIQAGRAGDDDMRLLHGAALELERAELATLVGRTTAAVTNRLSELRKLMNQLREELC